MRILIDRLPETQLSPPVGLLETIVDPAVTALRNAPVDDEPETEEEKQEAAESHDWLRQNGGRGIPHGSYAPAGSVAHGGWHELTKETMSLLACAIASAGRFHKSRTPAPPRARPPVDFLGFARTSERSAYAISCYSPS